MDFEFLKRKISVEKTHVLLVAGVGMGIALVFTLISFLWGFVYAGIVGETNWVALSFDFDLILAEVIGIFILPIYAFVLFLAADFLDKNRDVGLCRSLASANFLFIVAFSALGLFIAPFTGRIDVSGPLWSYFKTVLVPTVAGAMAIGVSSILLYLWMLMLLSIDTEKIRKAVGAAAVFAVIFFLFSEMFMLFSTHSSGGPYEYVFSSGDIVGILDVFILGLPLFYFVRKRKVDRAAFLFAGLYLGQGLLGFALTTNLPWEFVPNLLVFLERVATVVLVYILGEMKIK